MGQLPLVLLFGQFQGLSGGGQGLGELPRFGVGRGQRVEHVRGLAAAELLRPPGVLDRFRPTAPRRRRAGRQQPGHTLLRLRGAGPRGHRLAALPDALVQPGQPGRKRCQN